MATVTNLDLDATRLGLDGTTTYVEGAVAKLLAPNATVTSTGDFNGQTLVISHLLAEDQIGFASGVTVTNKNTIKIGTKVIGTFSGGTNGSDFIVTFTSNATQTQVQTLLRNLTLVDTSDAPTPTDQNLIFTLAGKTASDVVTVTAVNDAPLVDLNGAAPGTGATISFVEQTAVRIAPAAIVVDADSTNLTLTATLTTRPDGNYEALSLNAAAAAAAATAGLTWTYDAGQLSVTGSASQTTYQAILQGITYNNTSDNPSTTGRTVQVVVSDGAASSVQTANISVTPVNDAPVLDLNGADAGTANGIFYDIGNPVTKIAPSGTVIDPDSANFGGGSLRVALTQNGTATDQLKIVTDAIVTLTGGGGTTIKVNGTSIGTWSGGSNGTDLVITFNNSATPAAMQILLDHIGYINSSASPSVLPREVTFTLNDGDGTANGGSNVGLAIATITYANHIVGDSSDNVLIGTSRIDVIEGLGGRDTLQGLGSNDRLDGGSGFDRALYTDATGPITVDLGAGTASGAGVGSDTLISIEQVRGSSFNDSYTATTYTGVSPIGSVSAAYNEFEGMGGNDVIAGNGSTAVTYLTATSGVTVNITPWVSGQVGASGTATGDASVGTDSFTGVQGVRGSEFADTFHGSNNPSGTVEVFQGRGGNDFIDGGAGFDRVLYGFRIDDNVTGGISVNMGAGTVIGDASVGSDTLRSIEAMRATNFADTYDATGFGQAGALNVGSSGTFNEFEGLGGNDTITGNGNTRIDYINATSGVTVDLLAGTATGDASVGTDTFTGVNSIQGSYFADTLYGSNNGSSTTQSFDGAAGDDFIDGRGGFDLAYYNQGIGTVSGINVTVATYNVVGDAFKVVGDASIGTDTLIEIESVRGTNFDDTFNAVGFNGASPDLTTNGPHFNEFEGMGGDDTIIGNGLTGFAATRLTYASATGGVTVDLAAGTADGDLSVGHDTISGVNRVRGSFFNDTISGDANDNFLEGQGGDDVLNGRGGNDTLIGGGGADGLDGGSGFDRALYTDATGPITVDLGAGTASGAGVGSDTLISIEQVRGSSFNDSYTATTYTGVSPIGSVSAAYNEFEGMGGNDVIAGNGSTAVTYLTATSGVTVNITPWVSGQVGASGTATGDASVGTDSFTGVQGVRGSEFADTFHGSNNPSGTVEVFQGRGGNDFIDGGAGFDRVLYGFRIDDNVTGGISVNMGAGTVIGDASVGSDTLRSIEAMRATNFADTYDATGFGQAGALNVGSSGTFNEFEGLGGNDTITGNGNTRIDYINATSGVTVDLLAGTATGDASVGTDTFTGVNSIQGSYFADTLYGSNNGSSTTQSFDGAAGDDFIDGRGGFDLAYYNQGIGTVSGINVTVATYNVVGDAFKVVGDASIGTDTLIEIESVRGTNFDDTFNAVGFNGASPDLTTNGPHFNEFEGMGGDDTIIGNGLTGFAATRLTYASATGGVTVDLAAGTADGDLSVGHDTISGVNRVRGSFFNDTISGDANDNFLEGQGGDDVLNGRGGNDTLIGGGGADKFVYANNGGVDVVTDFNHAQGDKIDLTGVTGIFSLADVQAIATQSDVNTVINFGGGGNTLTLDNVTLANLTDNDFIFGTADASSGLTFSRTEYSTGGNPATVTIEDVNADGKPDIIAGGGSPGQISVRLGVGEGSFQAPIPVNVGGPTQFSIESGDLNGDGKQDLVVTNADNNTFSILLGNGDGTFQTPINYAADAYPFKVAISDLNLDGKADLIVSAYNGHSLTVFSGNGDGTFQQLVSYSTPSTPWAIVLGDVNSDGQIDMAVPNGAAGTVSIYLGNGDGTFQTPVNYANLDGALYAAFGDLNEDGKLDLVVGSDSLGTISVLLGNGDGTFTPDGTFSAGSHPIIVDDALYDVNRDGDLDLVIANSDADVGSVSVMLGNGDGTFDAPVATTDAGISTRWSDAADLNGDGKLDVVTTDYFGGSISVLLNTTPTTSEFSFSRSDFATGGGPEAFAVTDFNGDGKLDLAVPDIYADSASVLFGASSNSFSGSFDFAVGVHPNTVVAADLDHDGDQDLVINPGDSSAQLKVYLGDDSGDFQFASSQNVSGNAGFALADLNRDGNLDAVAADAYNGTGISVSLGNGDGTFQAQTHFGVGGLFGGPILADLNNDGKVDLAAGQSGGNTAVFLGNGDGTFQQPVSYATGTVNNLAVGDLNRDGNLDLVVGTDTGIQILLGNGESFTFGESLAIGSGHHYAAIGDLNGDGRLDVSVSNIATNTVSVFQGNGDGTFNSAATYNVGNNPLQIAIADLNGDGASDIAVSDVEGSAVTVLWNTGDWLLH